jgi:hypothetical protein
VKHVRHLFLVCAVALSISGMAQRDIVPVGQAWFRYYNLLQINSKTSFHSEVDERLNFASPHHAQFFIHLHLHHRLKPWLDVALGQNVNWTDSPVNPQLEVPEIRPWQEVSLISKAEKNWSFHFRYRLDHRFIHNHNHINLEDGYHFNLRHRVRFQAGTTLIKHQDDWKLALRVSDEFMVNTGDVPRPFDQNRIYGALEYKFNQHLSLETGYLNILQPVSDSVFLMRHVVRTTLYHRIAL